MEKGIHNNLINIPRITGLELNKSLLVSNPQVLIMTGRRDGAGVY